MHLQVPLDNSIFGEYTIVNSIGVGSMGTATDLVAFFERLRDFATDFFNDAGVIAACQAIRRCSTSYVLPNKDKTLVIVKCVA